MMKHGNLLTVLILIGLAAGCVYGQFVLFGSMGDNPDAHWTKQAGDLILIRPLFLLIIPLVFVSVVVGMTSIGDPSKLGLIGSSTVLYYLVTMLIAVTLGAILVTSFRPGDIKGRLVLEVVEGPDQGQRFELRSSEVYVIGTSSGTVLMTDPAVSPRHAELAYADDGWMLRSLAPEAQTLVNGQAITEPTLVRHGDRVHLGSGMMKVIAPQQQLVEEAENKYDASDIKGNVEDAEELGQDRLGGAWMNILRQMVPRNIFDEMAKGRTLGVIMFAILFGLALAAGGEATKPVVRLFEGLFAAVMKLVLWVIWLTPAGVFLLVAWTVGKVGFGELVGPLSKYIAVVLTGLAIHGFIVLPLILLLFTRKNPYRYMLQMRRALMTAFGTDSSAATLPVTLESAEGEGGCSKRAANFVLPLGATVNMDGTALYEAVAVVFLFQLWGIELSFTELLIVIITATLAAIGAAGIPSAGTVTMVIVIMAVNQGLQAQGAQSESLPVAAIGVIIGVDRIVDMCRTTVNVWGDAVGAKIITKLAPDPEEELEKALA